jgi:uncharacterized delta-60 repeat protein
MSKIHSPSSMLFAVLLAAAPLTAAPCRAADGDLDPGFGDGGVAFLSLDGIEGHELRTAEVVALPDGKLLFGGSRNLLIQGSPDPHMRAMLARMNADGSPDTGFGADPANPGILVLPSIDATGIQRIEALRRLDDGSIIAGGSSFAFGPLSGFIARFDADGHPDAGFGSDGMTRITGRYVHSLEIDGEGRIVFAGDQVAQGVYRGYVSRLDADGNLDPTFGTDAAGTTVFEPDLQDDNSYVTQIALTAEGGVVAGGFYEDSVAFASMFSVARLDAGGAFDTAFADGGWRLFRVPGDLSTFNGIDRLIVTADGDIAFGAHHDDGVGGTGVVLGRLGADGTDDGAFGDPATPGYAALDLLPNAFNRYVSALVEQADGKLLAGVTYATPERQDFVAFRVGADGALDGTFGDAGVVDFDLAPDGIYSDLTAMTLQDGKPILAGGARRSTESSLVDLAAARLQNGDGAEDDAIFADGFDGDTVPVTTVSDYDDFAEGFLGPEFDHDGIHYHDANGIGGVFPDGSTFTADDVGDQFIIEDASLMYPDFPDYGSPPNSLTFGTAFVPGGNLSVGALVRASMDLDAVATAVSVDLAYYERGPWGGIELHLDAFRDGQVVGSDMLTIASGDDRDNLTTATFAIDGVQFDALKLYATYDGQPSAPRVMIDDLTITR